MLPRSDDRDVVFTIGPRTTYDAWANLRDAIHALGYHYARLARSILDAFRRKA